MKTIVPGHVYDLWQLGSTSPQRLTFICRSGGAITYDKEWPGVQTQEVLRALIDRTQYLDDVLPCLESEDVLWHLRMALFLYEARAWRRKQEEVNRKQPQHDDSARVKLWHEKPFVDVPFNEQDIELRPIDKDGHIIV
jgi:hypothetical protein